MPDGHFLCCLCDRLLLPVCQEGARCQHRRSDGRLCNAPLDARGHHARKCNIGGALDASHNSIRDWTSQTWIDSFGVPAPTEQHVPEWDTEVVDPETGERHLEEAVLDVVTYDPHLGAAVQIDVAVTTACPEDQARLRARATKDGRGAADMAAEKRRRYSSAGPSLIPMIFEDGGRPAEETVALIRRLGCGTARLGRGGR